jgi:RimJ/RimL family protein N-acetyltransferase
VDDQTTLADVLKLVQADPTDARARLRLAELYAKGGDFTNAIAAFEWVGKFYAQQGYVMKSVAAYRQVRTLLSEKVPQLAPGYAHVLPLLVELLQRIGLQEEAATILEEIDESPHNRTTVDRLEAVQIPAAPASEARPQPLPPSRPLPPPPDPPAVPVLETARLRMRGHRVTDFAASAAMWSDPIVTRHIGGRPFTAEEVWSKILRYAGLWTLLGYGYWVVEERSTGKFVGEVGFANFKREIEPSLGDAPEAGWVLASWAHGKGFGTESVAAALAWGDVYFKGARTACVIDPGNLASIGVARKAGYKGSERRTYKGSPVLVSVR